MVSPLLTHWRYYSLALSHWSMSRWSYSYTKRSLSCVISIADALEIPQSCTESLLHIQLKELITKLSPDHVSKPLLKANLSAKQWDTVDFINKALQQEYECRREMLLKRLDVTIQSFKWSDRAKVVEWMTVLTLLILRLDYSRGTRSVLWLLMPWLLCVARLSEALILTMWNRHGMVLSCLRELNYRYLWCLRVEEWYELQLCNYVSSSKLNLQRVCS